MIVKKSCPKSVEARLYNSKYLSYQIGVPFLETGIFFIILMPIYGFLVIVGTRFLAEQFRALSAIANNTRKN